MPRITADVLLFYISADQPHPCLSAFHDITVHKKVMDISRKTKHHHSKTGMAEVKMNSVSDLILIL